MQTEILATQRKCSERSYESLVLSFFWGREEFLVAVHGRRAKKKDWPVFFLDGSVVFQLVGCAAIGVLHMKIS